MNKLREALRTLIRLLSGGPLGRGRPVYDDHSLRTVGKDDE